MAKLKKLKYPKKPKGNASVTTKENWLKKVADIDKENKRRESENKKSKDLSQKIANKRRV